MVRQSPPLSSQIIFYTTSGQTIVFTAYTHPKTFYLFVLPAQLHILPFTSDTHTRSHIYTHSTLVFQVFSQTCCSFSNSGLLVTFDSSDYKPNCCLFSSEFRTTRLGLNSIFKGLFGCVSLKNRTLCLRFVCWNRSDMIGVRVLDFEFGFLSLIGV